MVAVPFANAQAYDLAPITDTKDPGGLLNLPPACAIEQLCNMFH